MNEAYSTIWWSWITGPRRFYEAVLDQLRQTRSVCLRIPADMPWSDELRYMIEGKSQDLDMSVEVLDCSELELGQSVGEYLIRRFGGPDAAHSFRPHRYTAAAYLAKQKILRGKIVWITGLTTQYADLWKDFCHEYRCGAECGIFVLEQPESCMGTEFPRPTETLRYLDYASPLDTRIFASILAAEKYGNPLEADYVAQVAAGFCGLNAEATVQIVEQIHPLEQDPVGRYLELSSGIGVTDTPDGTDCGEDPSAGSRESQELRRKLWVAQVQIAFPMIESERVACVEENSASLQEFLPVMDAFGNKVMDPIDLELGQIIHLLYENGAMLNRNPVLSGNTEVKRIRLLHRMRNLLAHLDTCEPEQMKELLAGGTPGE